MFTIKRDLFASLIKIQIASIVTSVGFSVFTLIQQEKFMGWHPSGVERIRIRVIGVIFSYFLIKGKEF